METKEKKQVVTAISKATNILVTVGTDPTVDELSALLGLSLMLGKLDKHATAVFSGTIPPAISFLEPDKTFEDTVDGLRDFIIALNKDKADHLRYKLDGDLVKIFITPYKNTIIRDTDLEFSQGDFNVELIIALGVENKTDLDVAVASHGRILHDATTITLSAGSETSELGEIDWHAGSASSLSEMLVSLARDLGDDLIDERIATALMTGIVSNTERFSNNLTTSDVMKTAANLMALGANQQLIAARLEEAHELPAREEPAPKKAKAAPKKGSDDDGDGDGTMSIAHDESGNSLPPLPTGPSLVDVERHKDEILQQELDKVIPAATVDLNNLKDDLSEATPDDEPAAAPAPRADDSRHFVAKVSSYDQLNEPSMGGTLNATAEQAEEDNRAAIEADRNRVILSHDAPPAQLPDEPAPAPVQEPQEEVTPDEQVQPAAPASAGDEDEEDDDDDRPAPQPPQNQPSVEEALATLGYPANSHPTLAELDQKTGHSQPTLEVDDARAAVANALDTVFTPANNPVENIGSQPLGDIHPTEMPAPIAQPTPAPVSTAIDLPPLPPLPPLPGQEGSLPPLPPLPEQGELDAHEEEREAPASAAPTENDWQAHTIEPPEAHDPTQFRIPGQK